MIAESSVEAIRERVDIADLVREYVPNLRRAGRSFKACCPFHQERTPSFHVNPERQIFHCFGCQKGGDAFKFLMELEHLSFPEAVAKLGERVGIRIAPTEDQLGPRERELLKAREALAFAREFYAKVLATAPEAAEARRYLDARGLSPEMRQAYGIGFAPGGGSSLLQAALRKGYQPELLAKAGLAGSREGGGRGGPVGPAHGVSGERPDARRLRDFFRNRILFPIASVKGETVGFGARAMGDAQPKYLNSPDTPVFSKSRVLYGLYEGLAEVRKSRQALLLEGYMDVLAAHQFGLRTAAAPLGTAVTPEHAALLKRYADSVIFLFDPDAAGSSAALRGATLLLEQGLSVRIATVPDGLDPDELLHRDGRKALDAALAKAEDLPEFQTARALAGLKGRAGAEDKARVAREVLETIAKAPDEVLKSEWTRRLAQRLETDYEALVAQQRKGASAPAPRFRAQAPAPSPVKTPELSQLERMVLQAVLARPSLAADPVRVGDEDLASEAGRRILAALRLAGERGALAAIESLSLEDAALARGLLVDQLPGDPDALLAQKIEELRTVKRYRVLNERYMRMAAGELAKDAELIAEHARLRKVLNDRRLLNRI
ncbi:MAG: DNA primase [Elusimicrobia bacterium]|nr:DNA primase [Elusimicrobiota bacterium]